MPNPGRAIGKWGDPAQGARRGPPGAEVVCDCGLSKYGKQHALGAHPCRKCTTLLNAPLHPGGTAAKPTSAPPSHGLPMPFVVDKGPTGSRPTFTTRGVVAVCRYALDRWRQLPHLALSLARVPFSLIRLRLAVRRLNNGQPVLIIALVEYTGDIMAAEPIARLARRRCPDRKVLWITRKPYAPLVRAFPTVDAVFTVSCLTEWALVWRVSGLNTVWDINVGGTSCARCGLVVAKDRHLPSMQNYLHRGNILAVQCDLAGIPRMADGPRLTPAPRAREAIDRLGLPRRYIVIHCSSRDSRKDWVRERWAELVDSIAVSLRTSVIEVGTTPMVTRGNGFLRNLTGCLSILRPPRLFGAPPCLSGWTAARRTSPTQWERRV